jgi:hypothetical protein
MSRAVVILASQAERQRVAKWAMTAPLNSRVEFKAPKRSLPQNDKMWAHLTEVAQQVPYHGLKLTPDDYKLLFLDALKREVRMVPNLDGNGFVSLGRSSSDLSKEEMGDLITLIEAFGAQHGVSFGDQQQERAA